MLLPRYEEAFHKFVSSHDNYLRFEDDEEKRELMIDSYENQRDMKLQLETLVCEWRANRRRVSPPSEAGFSLKSDKSEKSNAISRNSVQERKRVVEEAKLEMQALQERQELQRKLEEVDKGRAELSRKLELLNARTKVKRTEIDLVVEQNVEGETKDGMNEYLKQHHAQSHLSNEALLPLSMNGATPTSRLQPISSEKEMSTPLAELNFAQSQLSVSSAQSSVETEPVVNLSSMPCVVSAVSSKASSEKVSAVTLPHSVECERIVSSAARLSHPKTTLVYTTASVPVYTLAGLSPIRNQSTPKTSAQPRNRQSTGLNADTAEFYPVIASQQTTPPLVNYLSPLAEGQSSVQTQQSDAWMTIAQAIKQGPSLPKVELMKFSGDPSEYAEFLTNFRDNIESQVSDESQRLTRLLAQCTGKAKEAIRSCVNLPVGQRYIVLRSVPNSPRELWPAPCDSRSRHEEIERNSGAES